MLFIQGGAELLTVIMHTGKQCHEITEMASAHGRWPRTLEELNFENHLFPEGKQQAYIEIKQD